MALNFFDVVGFRPDITIFGNNRYKTVFGKIVGSITVISILTLSVYFAVQTFIRSEISLLNNIINDHSAIDLSDSPIIIGFTDGANNPIPDNNYELRVNVINFTAPNPNESQKFFNREIILEDCTKEIIGKHMHRFEKLNISNYKCIPSKKENLTLFGSYGKPEDHNFINVYVNMCNNITTNNTCLSKYKIEPALKNVFLHLAFIDYEVDHYNFSHPVKSFLRYEVLPINWDLHARYFLSFNKLNYITDEGIVLVEKREDISYKFSHYTQTTQIRHGSLLYPDVSIGTVTVFKQPTSEKYNRTYLKLQTLLARIGGAIQSILIISKGLCHFATKNLFLIDMINLNLSKDWDNSESKEATRRQIKKLKINTSTNLALTNNVQIKSYDNR